MPTFNKLYESLTRQEKGEFIQLILKKLDINYSTFFNKKNFNTWTKAECIGISDLLKCSIETLFPSKFNKNWLEQPEISEKLKDKIYLNHT